MTCMETRRFHVPVEWGAENEVWVTHVPALGSPVDVRRCARRGFAQHPEAGLGYQEAAAREQLPITTDETLLDVAEIEVAAS